MRLSRQPLGGLGNYGERSMEAKVLLRLAVKQDANSIINVARITWHDTYAGIILPENQELLIGRWYTPSAIEEAINQKESWFYVAIVQELIIGYAQFVIRENGRGELTRIYVLPEYQRQGIGSRMLKEGIASFVKRGVEEAFVDVEKDNIKGINFYEREGFQRTRELSFELPGQNLKLLEYTLYGPPPIWWTLG